MQQQARKKDQIKNLEERIENNPDNETNYLALFIGIVKIMKKKKLLKQPRNY